MAPLGPVDKAWNITPLIDITSSQLNDGVQDCLYGIDEICSWKAKMYNWMNPLDSAQNYMQFMNSLESNPASTREYIMATRKEIRKLGHRNEVSG